MQYILILIKLEHKKENQNQDCFSYTAQKAEWKLCCHWDRRMYNRETKFDKLLDPTATDNIPQKKKKKKREKK